MSCKKSGTNMGDEKIISTSPEFEMELIFAVGFGVTGFRLTS
jgi:hypothetical protein